MKAEIHTKTNTCPRCKYKFIIFLKIKNQKKHYWIPSKYNIKHTRKGNIKCGHCNLKLIPEMPTKTPKKEKLQLGFINE